LKHIVGEHRKKLSGWVPTEEYRKMLMRRIDDIRVH
jgi:hypothetical protein